MKCHNRFCRSAIALFFFSKFLKKKKINSLCADALDVRSHKEQAAEKNRIIVATT